jgi:hypothetical protein
MRADAASSQGLGGLVGDLASFLMSGRVCAFDFSKHEWRATRSSQTKWLLNSAWLRGLDA